MRIFFIKWRCCHFIFKASHNFDTFTDHWACPSSKVVRLRRHWIPLCLESWLFLNSTLSEQWRFSSVRAWFQRQRILAIERSFWDQLWLFPWEWAHSLLVIKLRHESWSHKSSNVIFSGAHLFGEHVPFWCDTKTRVFLYKFFPQIVHVCHSCRRIHHFPDLILLLFPCTDFLHDLVPWWWRPWPILGLHTLGNMPLSCFLSELSEAVRALHHEVML